MNKKAEGAGGAIIFVVILVLAIMGLNNYVDNKEYEKMFQGCENFCIDNSQDYYGIDNFKEAHRTCVCSNQTYPIYRKGNWDMHILDNTGYKTGNDAYVATGEGGEE